MCRAVYGGYFTFSKSLRDVFLAISSLSTPCLIFTPLLQLFHPSLMNPELLLVIGLLLACVGMFVFNKPRMDVVALLAIVVLPLCGLTSVPEALAGLSDPNIILIT